MTIDWLYGRGVTEIRQGEENWQWEIVLDGDAVIRNKDKRRTAAPGNEIVGSGFMLATEQDTSTVLRFGTTPVTEITLTTKKYGLASPGRAEVEPGVPSDHAVTIPPDPSVDRVVDGPEKRHEL